MGPALPKAFFTFVGPFEGDSVPFMYLDEGDRNDPSVLGKVTTGTGNLLEQNGSPNQDTFNLPWKHKADLSFATQGEIETAWHAVKDRQDLRKKGGMIYENVTDLRLSKHDMDDFRLSHLKSDSNFLKKRFPAYESWPLDAQVAIHADAWAMGPAFKNPDFDEALSGLLPDFLAASKLRKCGNCNPKRNIATAQLFRNAASSLKTPGGNGTITPAKAPLALGVGTVVALGVGYVILHPLAVAGSGLTLHTLYKKVTGKK